MTTRLCDVLPAYLHTPGGMTDLRLLPALRRTHPPLYAKLLMGCAKQQVQLLMALWSPEFGAADVLRPVIVEMVKEGTYVPDLLDSRSQFARSKLDEKYIARLR